MYTFDIKYEPIYLYSKVHIGGREMKNYRFFILFGGFVGMVIGFLIGMLFGIYISGFISYFNMVNTENKDNKTEIIDEVVEGETDFISVKGVNINIKEFEKCDFESLIRYFKGLGFDEPNLSCDMYAEDVVGLELYTDDVLINILQEEYQMSHNVHVTFKVDWNDCSIKLFYIHEKNEDVESDLILSHVLISSDRHNFPDELLYSRPWTSSKDSMGKKIYSDYAEGYKVSYKVDPDKADTTFVIRTKDTILNIEDYYEEEYRKY